MSFLSWCLKLMSARESNNPPRLLLEVGLLCLSCFLFTHTAASDGTPYEGEANLVVEDKGIRVTHSHAWGGEQPKAFFFGKGRLASLLSEHNDFSTVTISKGSPETSTHVVPVPPLTNIFLLDSGSLIVGLSDIKLYNPYQVVAFDTQGTILLAEHISENEACLSTSDYESFVEEHPDAAAKLYPRTTKIASIVYLDFLWLGSRNELGDQAWDQLFDRKCKSRYSSHIAESVTNRVHWFRKTPTVDVRLEVLPNTGTRVLVVVGREGEEIRFEIDRAEKVR